MVEPIEHCRERQFSVIQETAPGDLDRFPEPYERRTAARLTEAAHVFTLFSCSSSTYLGRYTCLLTNSLKTIDLTSPGLMMNQSSNGWLCLYLCIKLLDFPSTSGVRRRRHWDSYINLCCLGYFREPADQCSGFNVRNDSIEITSSSDKLWTDVQDLLRWTKVLVSLNESFYVS